MTSQVFMPVQDEKPAVLNIQHSSRAQPLVLNAEDGVPVLALFSSPERAKEFTRDDPGFDMEPETVNELIDALSAGRTRH